MDASPIQYARTEDGVNIAYWTLGEGRPFVMTPWIPGCHLRGEWEVRQLRDLYERVASSRQLVKYDPRGFGLSDRTVTKISLDTHIQDLSTVIAALDTVPVDLFGSSRTSGAAMAFAARHPELVAHLLLWEGFADGGALAASPNYAALYGMVHADFEAYSEAVCRSVYGWSADNELVREFAEVIRQSGTPEMITAVHNAMAAQDVTPLLADITAPSVIIHDEYGNQFSLETAQDVARRIPDAKLITRRSEPGTTVWSWLGDICESFLGADLRGVDPGAVGALRVIPVSDPESAAALTRRESEVLRLMAQGLNNRQIGEVLTISRATAARHVSNLYKKIDCENRVEATRWAIEHALAD